MEFDALLSSLLSSRGFKASIVGLRMCHENNFHGRGSNDYLYSSNKEGPLTGHQHPKLAAILAARNHQDMRINGVPYPSAGPGHGGALNSGAGHSMQNMYNEEQVAYHSQKMLIQSLFSLVLHIFPVSHLQKPIVSSMKLALRMRMALLHLQLSTLRFTSLDIEGGAIFAPEEEHMSYVALLLAHLHVQQLF